MLSQIGCVAVPGDVLHRARTGGELSDEEYAVYMSHPQTAVRLLERIPRLEEVALWVGNQPVRPPVLETMSDDWQTHVDVTEPELPETLLRAGIAFLAVLDATGDPEKALAQLSNAGHYPAQILDALEEAAVSLAPNGVRRELTVPQVRPGMLLEMDVETKTGMILVRKGERVTEAVAMRLENFSRTVGVVEPIIVLDGV
jgi:hypothetical protein